MSQTLHQLSPLILCLSSFLFVFSVVFGVALTVTLLSSSALQQKIWPTENISTFGQIRPNIVDGPATFFLKTVHSTKYASQIEIPKLSYCAYNIACGSENCSLIEVYRITNKSAYLLFELLFSKDSTGKKE